jgi:polyhydroxyalkanoate synthesis regulator phasin
VGNITKDDARKLSAYTQILYRYIYARYEELEDVSDMTDESFMTEVDILCEEKERLQSQIDERDAAIAKKDSALAEKDLEIEALKKQLAALQNHDN